MSTRQKSSGRLLKAPVNAMKSPAMLLLQSSVGTYKSFQFSHITELNWSYDGSSLKDKLITLPEFDA